MSCPPPASPAPPCVPADTRAWCQPGRKHVVCHTGGLPGRMAPISSRAPGASGQRSSARASCPKGRGKHAWLSHFQRLGTRQGESETLSEPKGAPSRWHPLGLHGLVSSLSVDVPGACCQAGGGLPEASPRGPHTGE